MLGKITRLAGFSLTEGYMSAKIDSVLILNEASMSWSGSSEDEGGKNKTSSN